MSKVIPAKTMVNESWFKSALHTSKPIDVFILLGHNPVRQTVSSSTLGTVYKAIRAVHPKTPIQILGGHTHVRDFSVYDDSAVALESGRYCETLGWLSMSGFNGRNSHFEGSKNPKGVPNPTRPAKDYSTSPFKYARRYLDWNRKTFIYHSNQDAQTFDIRAGKKVTTDVTAVRDELKLGEVFGCVPKSYCQTCVPFDNSSNIFPGVIVPAVSAIVQNPARADKSRIILGNTGGIRFDLFKGPFTFDDNFIVSPFRDVWFYIPDVPYNLAKNVITK